MGIVTDKSQIKRSLPQFSRVRLFFIRRPCKAGSFPSDFNLSRSNLIFYRIISFVASFLVSFFIPSNCLKDLTVSK